MLDEPSSALDVTAELNVTMEKYGKPKIMILGVIKNGNINDYFKLIENEITNNSIFCLTDVIRDKYINFNRNASATTFGNETYYGQDFIYKTPTGRLFVFNVPYPFDTKSDISFFKEEKYQDAVKAFDKKEQYDVADAISIVKKKMPYAEMHGLEMERVEDYLVEVFEVATDEEEDE